MTSRRRAVRIAAAITLVVAAALVSVAAIRAPSQRRAAIRQSVDRSAHGTLAYVTASDPCVQMISISDVPTAADGCPSTGGGSSAPPTSAPPRLEWLPGGRLSVTTDPIAGHVYASAQEAAAAELAASGHPSTSTDASPDDTDSDDTDSAQRPTTNHLGQTVSVQRSGREGHRVVVVTASGSTIARITLPTAARSDRPPVAFWTPDGERILVDDGRLLLLHPTPGARPVLLAPRPVAPDGDPAGAPASRRTGDLVVAYAVTGTEVIPPDHSAKDDPARPSA